MTAAPTLQGGIIMPYVNIPNDLSKIKSKVALNLTKRQLLCFGGAAAIGIPTYLLARTVIGNSAALFLMIALMLPAFMLAMYERDGLPAEKVARNIILAKFLRPGARPYKTENFYAILTKEEKTVEPGKKAEKPAKRNKAQKQRAPVRTEIPAISGNAAGRRLQSQGRVLHKDDRV